MLKPNPDYPVRLEVDYYAKPPARLSTFFRWILAIPQVIVLACLGIAAFLVAVIAAFAVLFTGRYPRSLFDFLIGVQRWSARVAAYLLLVTDRYPPFSLRDDPAYPVRVQFDYPERIARWRPFVNWILIIPFAYAAQGVMYAAYFVAIAAWCMILFKRRYPDGMFEFVVIGLRWTMRQNMYQLWMTERYPAIEW